MWFRQMPFLTLAVFSIGVGLGVAWKSGWIPIEIRSANTGTLETSDALETGAERPLTIPVAQLAPPNRLLPDDPAIFASQSEPGANEFPVEARQSPPAAPSRDVESNRLKQERRTVPEEQEWARDEASRAIEDQSEIAPPAAAVPAPYRRPAGTPPREVRLASNEEPPVTSREDAPRELDSNVSLADALKEIDRQIAAGEILPPHRSLSKLYWNHKDWRGELMERLDVTSQAIFFEPRPHLVDPYVVQANDQMRLIAKKYDISWEYLAKLNRTEPRRLQPGQKLKVLKGPFAAVVDLQEFALTIHLQGYFVKRYEVGIGKDGASPIGKFPVLDKIENPQYTGPDGKVIAADDPKNPLGERWIDLGDSYGIHGTIEPESIGKAASRGCIRMRTGDVIEVYNFLVKGSEVVIRK